MLRRDGPGWRGAVLAGNSTLQSVVELCRRRDGWLRRVRQVITLNFDNLLELMLGPHTARPVWREPQNDRLEDLLIFHVHGYVPVEGPGSRADELVFA